MTEKRFTVDYDITVGNYCLHDKEKDTGVDGYIAYLSSEERANNLCTLLNEQDAEIKRLKRTMKDVAELLSTEADLFSDKATEHDINAYIELKEFDNKDAYYMAVSIKKAIKMLKGDVE